MRLAAAATAAELECSEAMGLGHANQASLFQGLLGGRLVRREARNGVALGNDPAPAAPCGHEIHLNATVFVNKQWERTDLTQFLFPSEHETAYPKSATVR